MISSIASILVGIAILMFISAIALAVFLTFDTSSKTAYATEEDIRRQALGSDSAEYPVNAVSQIVHFPAE